MTRTLPILIVLLAAGMCRGEGVKELPPAQSACVARIDKALARAGEYLLDAQSDDGAWYSRQYGALKTGPTMTPYVLSSLLFMPQTGEPGRKAFNRGVGFLLKPLRRDGSLDIGPRELIYPVYTAAMASRIVAHPKPSSPSGRQGQLAWLDYLRRRQLAEPLGWQPSDADYGGWGYSIGPPEKPEEGGIAGPFHRANLSATTFTVAAFRSAGIPSDDPVYRQALVFIERCQNFGEGPFNDGGFFFMPEDAAQNKAGVAGVDETGQVRFRSYGTMTADGLRCLVRCGLPPENPRVVAARRWLMRNFSATENPGAFPPDRRILQNATYYYWVWALAHAMLAVRSPTLETDASDVDWPTLLADTLIRQQCADGTWRNRYTDAKEDDPLVATPWAAAALAICRAMITRDFEGCRASPNR